MPAYANKDGKVVCFFQSAAKFKARYATFGFNDTANLDEGNMWPVAFALKKLTPAEEVKIAVGSAFPLKREKEGNPLQVVVRGRSLENGLPKSLKLDSVEIREAMMPIINQILSEIHLIIEETPPELVSDIMQRGIILAGGGSLIRGLDKLVADQTEMPVRMMEDPLTAVVRGTGIVLEDIEALREVLVENQHEKSLR